MPTNQDDRNTINWHSDLIQNAQRRAKMLIQ